MPTWLHGRGDKHLRAFIGIGAAVALFWVAAIYVMANRYAPSPDTADTPCRNEQILLAVSKNQHVISGIEQQGNDLVIAVNWNYWMALNLERKTDIGKAAWCIVAHEGKGGVVRILSVQTEVGRVENGKWASRFGE